jgi:hypothetical protein
VKDPVLRTNPKIDEVPTAPKPLTHPSHPETPHPSTPAFILRFYILFHFAVFKKHYFVKRWVCGCGERNMVCVYYESMKRKLKIKPIYECRCNGRLQTKRFTRLEHTGLVVELEHVKIKTRLTNEKFVSVKGECEI